LLGHVLAGFAPVSSSNLFGAQTLASLLGFSVGALVSVEVVADQNNWPWQKLIGIH
jgi:hypothetical protein